MPRRANRSAPLTPQEELTRDLVHLHTATDESIAMEWGIELRYAQDTRADAIESRLYRGEADGLDTADALRIARQAEYDVTSARLAAIRGEGQ